MLLLIEFVLGFDSHVGRIFELIGEKNEKIKKRNQVLRAPYVHEDSSVKKLAIRCGEYDEGRKG